MPHRQAPEQLANKIITGSTLRGCTIDESNNVAGGGGSGALEDLTDAPDLVLNVAATVEAPAPSASLTISTSNDPEEAGAVSSITHNVAGDNTYGETSLEVKANFPGSTAAAIASITLAAYTDTDVAQVEMSKPSGAEFLLTGFDLAASDATATMTVNAVEYDIARCIQVNIDGSTYFIPCFGPVV